MSVKMPALNSSNLNIVDLDAVRRLCYKGIEGKGNIRSVCWRILLGYLPVDKREWKVELNRNRSFYYGFIKELYDVQHSHGTTEKNHRGSEDNRTLVDGKDVEAIANKKRYESKILIQILRDVKRTLPRDDFLQNRLSEERSKEKCMDSDEDGGSTSSSRSGSVEIFDSIEEFHDSLGFKLKENQKIGRMANSSSLMTDLKCFAFYEKYLNLADGESFHIADAFIETPPQTHMDIVARILYIYAILNKGVGYIQGMNEMIIPFYYVLYTQAPTVDDKAAAEADAFFLLFKILSGQTLNNFIGEMDETADDDIGKEKAEIRNMKGHVNYGMSIYGNGSGPESSPDSDTLTSIQDGIANKIAMLFGTNKEDGKDVESLSKESGGIQRQLNRWWNEVVSKVDPRLWRHMRYLGYKPEDFALRWMLVWCAREFPLDEVIKLWDSLIAEKSFEIVKKNTEIKKEAEAPSEIKGMEEQQEGNKTKNEVKSEDSGASGMRNPNTSSRAQISQDNRPNRLVRKGDAGGGGGGRGGGGGGMFSFMSFMNIQSMMYTDASASARPKPKENVQYIVKDIDLRKSRRESLDKNVIIVKNLDDFSKSQEIIVKPLATENNTITNENGINKEGLGKGASNEIRLKDGPSFLMYFITAMLVVLREPILKSDFSGGMLALQTFSQENTTIIIEDLLNVANQIKNIFARYSGSLPASGVINELALPKIDLGLEEHDYSTQPDVNADNERMHFYDTDQNTDTTTNVNTKNYDDGVSSKDIHVSDNDTEKNGKEENMDGRGSEISLTQLAEHNKNHVLEEELNGADPTTPVDPPSLDKQYSISLPKSEEKRGGSTDNVNYQKSIEDSSAIIISNSPLW